MEAVDSISTVTRLLMVYSLRSSYDIFPSKNLKSIPVILTAMSSRAAGHEYCTIAPMKRYLLSQRSKTSYLPMQVRYLHPTPPPSNWLEGSIKGIVFAINSWLKH